jgi:GNAT superfamily N-acetyltransferase
MVDYRVTLTADPAAFRDRAARVLAADPVRTSVLGSMTRRWVEAFARGDERPAYPLWWATVEDARGVVVSAAMRTASYAPHPMWVGAMPVPAAAALAEAVLERGETVTQVSGALAAGRAFAEALAAQAGGRVELSRPDLLWEVTDVVTPPAAPGRPRLAGSGDVELAAEWFGDFRRAAELQVGRAAGDPGPIAARREQARRRIGSGELWLWEDDGRPVHLTGVGTPSFGVVRVGPVFTPDEHRGRGYAQAMVAHVSARALADGHRVCLYTDGGNAVSSHVYAAIGYRQIDEHATFTIQPADEPVAVL